MTPGSDNDTADGFSAEYVHELIENQFMGFHSANERYFRGCQIQSFFGEKSTGFYGSGTLTECQISAMAEENGYGIHAKSSFLRQIVNFLGYTEKRSEF